MTVPANQQAAGNAATGAGGCAVKPANLPRPKPVSVNGVGIPRAAIARETQNHPAGKPIEAWMSAARALVVRELLLQEARRLGIAPQPVCDAEGRRETDEEALVRQLVAQEVVTPVADDVTCRRIYDTQSGKFRSSDLYGVRHILFAAAPGAQTARVEAQAMADAAIATLTSAPDQFEALAAAHSACPSRAQGGALGQISRGQTVPEFEEALAAAPVGRVCPTPVETRYGFHVVQVDQRIEGRALPFEMVQAQIAAWLDARARHIAIRQYIGLLAGRATIVGIEMPAHDGPRPS